MVEIATFVFLDLETTGLPQYELNKTKITELSLVAVKRGHVLETKPGMTPRVQHKLTLCLNPGRLIDPGCTQVTGLDNDILEQEPYFNIDVFNTINTFLNLLTPPVCLIAQNGLRFDFPILKAQLEKLDVNFSEELMCADCYHAFYDILEAAKREAASVGNRIPECPESAEIILEVNKKTVPDTKSLNGDYLNKSADTFSMQCYNETTPKKKINSVVPKSPTKEPRQGKCMQRMKHTACRKLPWSIGEKPRDSYKLSNIYQRLLNREPLDAHRAENDCLMALQCSVAKSKDFVSWVDENHCQFSIIKSMKPGVPLGD